MLFYPLAWRGVPAPAPLARLAPRAFGRVAAADGSLPPFGPLLGWQGVVPAKAPRMARDLVAVVAGDGGLASVRADINYSTRLQCARHRTVRTRLFCRASRNRREHSIRPKISRIDFDVTEREFGGDPPNRRSESAPPSAFCSARTTSAASQSRS